MACSSSRQTASFFGNSVCDHAAIRTSKSTKGYLRNGARCNPFGDRLEGSGGKRGNSKSWYLWCYRHCSTLIGHRCKHEAPGRSVGVRHWMTQATEDILAEEIRELK